MQQKYSYFNSPPIEELSPKGDEKLVIADVINLIIIE